MRARGAGRGRRARRDSHVGRRVGAEGHDLGAARDALHHQALLGAGHHRAARGGEQRGLFVGDFLEAAQPLAVLDVDVEHGGDVGLDDSRQTHNLAARVGAALQHGGAMALGEREDRHRHADKIVEIARRGQRFTEERAHHGCAELLGAGLADRAADRDACERMRRAHAPQMMAREIAKGGERVVDFDRGKAGEIGETAAALDYRSGRAAARGLGQVRMAVAARRLEAPRTGRRRRATRVSLVTPRTVVSGAPNISPPVAAATSSSLKAHWLIGIGVAIVAAARPRRIDRRGPNSDYVSRCGLTTVRRADKPRSSKACVERSYRWPRPHRRWSA